MKRILSLLLAAILLLGLCACEKGPEIAEEDMAVYEAYAMAAAKYGKYSSSEVVQRVLVRTGEDTAGFVTKLSGQLETTDLSGAGAIVVIYSNYGERILVMNKSVAEGTSAEEAVLYAVASDAISFSSGGGTAATAADTPAGMGQEEYEAAVLLEELGVEDEGDADALRWKLAQQELDYEAYCEREDVAAVLATYEPQLTDIRASGEDYTLNEQWLSLQTENSVLAACGKYERDIAQTRRHLTAAEAIEADSSLSREDGYARMAEVYREDIRLQTWVNAKLGEANLKRAVEKYAEEGQAQYEQIASQVEELKTQYGEDYRATVEFFLLRRGVKGDQSANPVYYSYEQAQWNLWNQQRYMQMLEESNAAKETYEVRYIERMYELKTEYFDDFRDLAIQYANATADYDAYLKANEGDYTAYTTAAEAIKSKYTDNSYEKDMDYIKLQLQHEGLLKGIAAHEATMAEIKGQIDELTADFEKEAADIQADYDEAVENAKAKRDREKITKALTDIAVEMKASEEDAVPESKKETTTFCLQVEGETVSEWVVSTVAYTSRLEGATSTYVRPSSGGGSGGGSSSSKKYRCSNCGKSMSYEAMYCSSCLNSYFGGNYFTD